MPENNSRLEDYFSDVRNFVNTDDYEIKCNCCNEYIPDSYLEDGEKSFCCPFCGGENFNIVVIE